MAPGTRYYSLAKVDSLRRVLMVDFWTFKFMIEYGRAFWTKQENKQETLENQRFKQT